MEGVRGRTNAPSPSGEGDGLDELLIEADEFQLVPGVVDLDVREIQEHVLVVVEEIGHPVTHGGEQDIADIGRMDCPDFDADLLALSWHERASLRRTRRLGPAASEFHAPAELPVLVLPHLLAALLDDTRHDALLSASSNLPNPVGDSK